VALGVALSAEGDEVGFRIVAARATSLEVVGIARRPETDQARTVPHFLKIRFADKSRLFA
jgi:hypothetical protein